MPITKDKIRSKTNNQRASGQRGLEAPPAAPLDVRATVERQFTLMEQAHDRIRSEKLAVRLHQRMEN